MVMLTFMTYTLNRILTASMTNNRLRHGNLIPDWVLLLTAHYSWVERDTLMAFQKLLTTKYLLRKNVWRKIL